MWSAYTKSENCTDSVESLKFGRVWIHHLNIITKSVDFNDTTLTSKWEDIINKYSMTAPNKANTVDAKNRMDD
jgi:hypothetical protein